MMNLWGWLYEFQTDRRFDNDVFRITKARINPNMIKFRVIAKELQDWRKVDIWQKESR